jgi:uncharacterized protein (TIGR03084 family)
MHVTEVAADLATEQQVLDDLLTGITDADWATPTSSPRWSVADQVAHLTYFDRTAALAITDPDRFRTMLDDLVGVAGGGDGAVDDLTLGRARKMSPPGVFEAWRANRRLLADAAATLADDSRVIWYGPSMGAKSFLTARLMEVWAHGQDIVDALGLDRPTSDRLRHVAQLGVITRNWSYVNRRMDVPEDEVRVELTAPSGDGWAWGPEGAPNAVRGSAEDFCLVVTQRRHADDTDLDIGGEAAHDWLLRAQAFAGPPTDGPDPGRF